MATPATPNPQELQKLVDLYKQMEGYTDAQAKSMADIVASSGNLRKETKRIQDDFASIGSSFSSMARSLKDSIQEFSKVNTFAASTKKSFGALQSISSKLASDQSGFSRLSEKELKTLKEKVALEAKNLANNIKSGELTESQLTETDDVFKQTSELIKLIEKRLDREKEVTKAIGLTGNALKLLSKIPGLGSVLKTEEAIDKMKDLADKMKDEGKNITSFGSKLKIAGAGLKTAFSGIKEALTDPVTIFTFIVEKALAFNSASVNIGKNLGAGTKEADKIAKNLSSIANNSNNVNVTFKNATEAMSQLNEATGGVANYSADVLETQIMLTKQFGLTGEEAAGLYKFSVLTGKASSQVNKEMVGAFVNTRNATKGSANFKTTMAEVAKISGQLAVNFKNNPAALTAAVVQAQALGTTLEQTKNQGKKLLDFTSSIENELEAELLTGQQINLERARAAALQGDQVTVMKELVNQGMTLEKFTNMNVLAQESFAKALGLSADELSDQLKKQKIATEQGKSLAQVNAEELEKAEKRQSLQDKFNAAIEKLSDFFGNLVAGPFGEFFSLLSDSLDIITAILYPFQLIYNIASQIGGAISGLIDKLGVFGKALKVVAGIGIVMAAMATFTAVSTGLAATIIGGLAAPVVGAAAAAGVLSLGFGLLNTKSVGDMMSPADGRTQVSTKEGGLFELSKNDDLVAFPGAAKMASGGGGGESIQGPSIDLTPMINAINATTAAIDKLYNKDTSIYIDGKKVGTTLSQGSYKVA